MFTKYVMRFGEDNFDGEWDNGYESAWHMMLLIKKIIDLKDWDFDDPYYDNYN